MNLNGAGNNIGALTTNGGIINLNDGSTIAFTLATLLTPVFPTSPSLTTEPRELEASPPVLPVDPPPETLSPGLHPIIGPELATYGAVVPTALRDTSIAANEVDAQFLLK